MNTKTFYDLILEDIGKGRTYTYAMYLATVNRDREDPLTFEQAADAHGHLLDFSGGQFSSAKLLKEPAKQEEAPPLRSAPPVEDTNEKDGAKQVPWKAPDNQGQHMKAIRESRTLKKNARLVAFEAHVQIGITTAEKKIPFGQVKRELTPEYLAMFTGLSKRTVDVAMSEACRLGFFRRIDNGKGGKGNTNRATYMPTVPAWS